MGVPKHHLKRRPGDITVSEVTCTALVQLDTGQIRRKAIGSLKRSRTSYAKAEKEWDFFVQEESPAFHKWVNVTFGAKLTQCRDLQQKLEYTSMLCSEIIYQSRLTGDPYHVCYERIMDRIEHPEKYREEASRDDFFERDPSEEEDSWSDDDADEDMEYAEFETFLNNLLGVKEEEEDSTFSHKHHKQRIRQIYRELARRIHPDSSGEMSAEIKQLWHAVQEAYEREDLEQLEVLQAHLDMIGGQLADTSSVFQIKELTGRFRHALKALRATIRKARNDPAWGFLSLPGFKKDMMKKKLDWAFDHDIEQLEVDLAHMEEKLESLKTPIRPSSRSGPFLLLSDLMTEDGLDFEFGF